MSKAQVILVTIVAFATALSVPALSKPTTDVSKIVRACIDGKYDKLDPGRCYLPHEKVWCSSWVMNSISNKLHCSNAATYRPKSERNIWQFQAQEAELPISSYAGTSKLFYIGNYDNEDVYWILKGPFKDNVAVKLRDEVDLYSPRFIQVNDRDLFSWLSKKSGIAK